MNNDILAQMIWAEARGEPDVGKRAVAHVALNRVKSSRFPNDINSVITARHQFVHIRGSGPLWEHCKRIAENPGEDPTGGALYFATYVAWPRKRRHGKIGAHYFFS